MLLLSSQNTHAAWWLVMLHFVLAHVAGFSMLHAIPMIKIWQLPDWDKFSALLWENE